MRTMAFLTYPMLRTAFEMERLIFRKRPAPRYYDGKSPYLPLLD